MTELKTLRDIGKRYYLTKKFYVWNDGFGRYWCNYNKEELGYLEFYKSWKKWVWNPNEDIIMSKSCLNLVIKMMDNLVKEDLE